MVLYLAPLSLFICRLVLADTPEKTMVLSPGNELIAVVKHREDGSFKCILSEEGARIESLNTGRGVVTAAPDWKVVIYNPQTKFKWSCVLDKFSPETMYGGNFNDASEPVKRILPASLPKLSRNGFVCVMSRTKIPTGSIYTDWWADTNLPPKVLEFYNRYFYFPNSPGKVVVEDEVNAASTNSQQHRLLNEASPQYSSFLGEIRGAPKDGKLFEVLSVHQVRVNDNDFKCPAGYVEKRDAFEVLDLKKKDIIEIFDNSFASGGKQKK